MVLYEDKETNRMHESLQLFKDICAFPYFTNITFIVFLNKYDLFLEKMKQGKSIKSAFPEYPGGCNPEESIEYIKNKFKEVNNNFSKELYFYETTAIDREKLIVIWDGVSFIAMNNTLEGGLNMKLTWPCNE